MAHRAHADETLGIHGRRAGGHDGENNAGLGHLADEYIHVFNHERLKTKTGLATLSLRQASL